MADPRPRRPLGKAIRRTAAEREALARVTAADVLEARMLWHEAAPGEWRGLIEAKAESSKDET